MSHVSPEVALAITRQKARYARHADTKRWDLFEKIHVPNGRFSFLGTDGEPLVMGRTLVFDTAKSFAAFFEKFFDSLETIHNIGLPDFAKSEENPNEVRAVFGFEDNLISKRFGSWVEIRGGGFYNETWQLIDGEWYIKELSMRRTYQKVSLLAWVFLLAATVFEISPRM